MNIKLYGKNKNFVQLSPTQKCFEEPMNSLTHSNSNSSLINHNRIKKKPKHLISKDPVTRMNKSPSYKIHFGG